MKIEIAVVNADGALREEVAVPPGVTVADALAVSALAAEAEGEEGELAIAIHGALASTRRTLEEGERIDLLPALLVAPAEARRRRAEAQQGGQPDVGVGLDVGVGPDVGVGRETGDDR